MFRALILAFVTLTTLSFQCRKNCETEKQVEDGIVGKWKFTQYYMDPGDGSGTWGPAPANQTYVEFGSNGNITTDVGMLNGYKRYELAANSMIIFYRTDGTSISMRYELTGLTLIIRPPCFEGCGLRFEKFR